MKILIEHLKGNLEILNKTSELAGLATHPVNIGVGREAIISSFLKQNLPSFIDYHTGELFDSDEKRSGQLDIILHPITSPKLNLNGTINIFPVETVLACIEVKSNLTGGKTGSLVEALKTCKMVKELTKVNKINEYKDMIDLSSVPFLVLAFNSSKPETLLENLNTFSSQSTAVGKFEYRYLPDMIVVLKAMDNGLNKPYYIYKTNQWTYAGATFDKVIKKSNDNVEVLLGPFEFLIRLIENWSKNFEKNIMPIESYTKDKYENSLFKLLFKETEKK